MRRLASGAAEYSVQDSDIEDGPVKRGLLGTTSDGVRLHMITGPQIRCNDR